MRQHALRLMHVTTVSASVRSFLLGHIHYARQRGASVEVVCGADDYVQDLSGEVGVSVHELPLKRVISPRHDLIALWRMWRVFRRIRPDIVHAHTPKGGLIGMIASFLARVPHRVYTVHGLVHVSKTGWKRWLLTTTERLSCLFAHRVLCVSPSILDILVDEGLCKASKAGVVAHGSICGVDLKRFACSPERLAQAQAFKAGLGIPKQALVLGFVGRLTRDKGVVELYEAWEQVRQQYPAAHLLVVGAFEAGDVVPDAVRAGLENNERVHIVGWQADVVPYFLLMDVLVLPTYREGFGLVLIEAAAMGVPSVATRIPGCVDAVDDGVTGFLVPVQNGEAVAEACCRLFAEAELRGQMGKAGQRWVSERFRPEPIWAGYFDEYLRLTRRTSQD